MLNSVLALILILSFRYFLNVQFDLHPAITPLVSITCLVNIAIIFSMFNMLKLGVLAAYVLAAVSFGYVVYKNRCRLTDTFTNFFTPGVIMFTLACFLFLAVLFTRKPMFSEWDEFSFWGTARKLVKVHGSLYTFYKSSLIGNSTPPALAVLSYFFQCFTPEFLEHACFFAYDVLIMASVCALTRGLKKDDWDTRFFMFLLGFVLPYLFKVYTKLIFLDTLYISSYSDYPLGMVFMGAFAIYFFSDYNNSKSVLPVLPVLAFLTMTKDMGMRLGCIVLFMAFFDMLCYRKEFSFLKVKNIFGKILAAFSMLIVIGTSFFAWIYHMGRVMQRNRFETGGDANASMFRILIEGTKNLLGIGPEYEKFNIIKGYMVDVFFNRQVFIFGTGLLVVCLITLIFAVGFLLGNKGRKLRIVSLYLTSTIGFIGYYIFHLYLYVYIFKANGYDLVSYNRYMRIYYTGWLAIAVMSVAVAVNGKKRRLSKIAVMAIALVAFGAFSRYASVNTIFVESDYRAFQTRNSVKRNVEFLKDEIRDDDVIYAYCQSGERWFIYTLELAENYLAEVVGIATEGLTEEEQLDAWHRQLEKEIKRLGVTAVLVEGPNEFLQNTYGDLFSDRLADSGDGQIAYYRVVPDGEKFSFQLAKKGAVQ